MHAVVLHNRVATGDLAEQDVLVQASAIEAALTHRAHTVSRLACSLDLESARADLLRLRPDVVVNLVESLGGTDHMLAAAALLLEALGIPFTGSPAFALLGSGDKPLAKQHLTAAGLPTPCWLTSRPDPPLAARWDAWCVGRAAAHAEPPQMILKPAREHASTDLDDHSLRDALPAEESMAALRHLERQHGRPYLAEQFIAGREFNLSLLARACEGRPEVLPAAEILFQDFPDDKPRIVGRRAKWDVDSFEYQNTPRSFLAGVEDDGLVNRLGELAVSTWTCLRAAGYARVDFRVDSTGQPWILELNANPCLAPDAGFAAALQTAGIPFEIGIERIVRAAFSP